jgi:hypothetical protein
VINRMLRRRHEPRSIFEHVDAHVRPGIAGLTPGGEILPDEQPASRSEIRWAPGALEGVTAGALGTPDERAAVERIHGALAALAARPRRATRRRLRELFREGHVRGRIDGLRDRLTAESPAHAERLYPELRELFLTSGHRDEVKYAMALMSGFGRREDADLFRIVARHAEFTLYAAIALASVSADPVDEWLGLLPHVTGWGRTELSELILREPRSEVVRERLLRDGLGVGNALTLASGCRLDELLARPQVDDELLESACGIIDALVGQWDSPAVLTDYDEAGPAVEALLRHLDGRPRSLAGFLTVFDLRRFLMAYEAGDEDLAACGLDAERCARVVALCTVLLDGDGWRGEIEAALESDVADERRLGMEAATRLGVDLHAYLLDRLEREPGDSGLWFRLLAGADEIRVREAVAAALSLWDLSEIARGPALDLFGDADGPLGSVDYLLQELPRFPGVGGPLLEASLQSPVIRHRLAALRALAGWEHVPADLLERIAHARASDPDEDVRASAARVLAGETIPER